MCVDVTEATDNVEVLEVLEPKSAIVKTEASEEEPDSLKRRTSLHSHGSHGGSGGGLLAGLSFGHAALSTTFQSLHARICSFKGWSYLGVPPPAPSSQQPANQLVEHRPRRIIRFVGSTSHKGSAPVLELRAVDVDSDDTGDSDSEGEGESGNSGDEEDCSEDGDELDNSSDSETQTAEGNALQYSQPDLMRLSLEALPVEDAALAHTASGLTSSQRCTSAPCTSDCSMSNHFQHHAHAHRHNHHHGSPQNHHGSPNGNGFHRPMLLLELPSPVASTSSTGHSATAVIAGSPPTMGTSPRSLAYGCMSSPQMLMLMPPGSATSPRGGSGNGLCSSPRQQHSPQSPDSSPILWLPEVIKCGLFCEQGTRASNEDMAFALEIFEQPPCPDGSDWGQASPDPNVPAFSRAACFGVFDGHGGIEAAEHMTKNLPGLIASRCSHIKAQGAEEVTSIMLALEAQLQERFHAEWHSTGRDPGTTALVATVIDDTLLVANVGDCRLILVAEAVDAQGNRMAYVAHGTKDHTCGKNELEHQRVKEAGAHVDADGYVGSLLEVSRSIGDFRTKSELGAGVIIPDPEVTTVQLSPDSLFVVAFSDGISSKMDDCAVCNMVAGLLNDKRHPNDPSYAARELCTYAVGSAGSSDNCSAVVVVLRNEAPPAPARRRMFGRK